MGAGLSGLAIVGLGVLAVVGLVIIWIVITYNGLVRRRVDCDNAFSQIDVQLKRRWDLIPNLIETVKGYATHEKATLDAVISARAKAMSCAAGSVAERAQAESFLGGALGRLMAVAEAYPDLKANQNFLGLQEELTSTENKIGFARQHFNDTVGKYEASRQQFPTVVIAGAFNFNKRDYFELTEQEAREAPKVSFS